MGSFTLSINRITSIMVVFILLISLTPMTMNVRSEVESHYTWQPSANNATRWQVYPHGWSGYMPCQEIKVTHDEQYYTIYTGTSGIVVWAKTNDYNNPNWIDPEQEPLVGYLPPSGATIVWVHIWAEWLGNYGNIAGQPESVLYFTVNGGTTWYSSGTFPEKRANSLQKYVSQTWDVTNYISWTPEIINNTNFQVKLQAHPTPNTYYYLDYLGISVMWYIGTSPPPEEPEEGGGSTTPSRVVSILWFVGLVGMIGTPPMTIWIFKRQQESGIVSFVIGLAVFMLFFALFLAGMER